MRVLLIWLTTMANIRSISFLVVLAVLCSCSSRNQGSASLTGLGIGTATGAVVGMSSSNIRASDAALIGAGAGLVAGAVVDSGALDIDEELSVNEDAMMENAALISAQQQEIEKLRETVAVESAEADANLDNARYKYVGPSLGNRYR